MTKGHYHPAFYDNPTMGLHGCYQEGQSMKDVAMNRSKRPGGRWVLGSAAACLAWLASGTASAVPIEYTMTWNNVSGTLNGVPFSNETLVVKLVGDTDDVMTNSPFQSIKFPNGAGVTISLGATLAETALDDDPVNTSQLFAVIGTSNIFLQGFRLNFPEFPDILADKAFLASLTNAPAENSLGTFWAGTTNLAGIANTWDDPAAAGYSVVTVNGGQVIRVVTRTSGTGSWNSVEGVALPSTTTVITGVSPSPVVEGNSYTVSGTVAVDESESAPSEGNLPGSVMVDGDGAGCEDSDLVPSSAGTGTYDFECQIVAGAPGEKELTVSFLDSSDPKQFGGSSGLGAQTVEAAPPPPAVSCEGFFAPVDRAPTVNKANAGRVIPLKWRCMNGDVPVSSYESFSITSQYCPSDAADSSATDAIEEYAPGSTGLKYHGDGYWQFNWATHKSYARSCRTVTVSFDGETLDASFQFVR
ncbi:MAG: PxKF domain-containing protein [Steroidobacteraceae bacterium]